MTKLYELTGDFLSLQSEAESGNLPAEAIKDTLEGIEGEIKLKGENIAMIVANWDSDVDAIDKQLNVLQKRKKAVKNKQEALKDYLRENMERTGIKKIECPLFTINCVSGRDNAVIDDIKKLPDDYVDVITDIKPMKAKIAEALKAGEEIEGAHLEKTKSSIRIK